MTEAVLDIRNVCKRFGDNLANDDISLSLGKGEIVALLGENGAGKTTLMSILFGHYVPDTGKVLVGGRELPSGKPRAAIRAGIGMVHQHFSLAPNLTVLENVMAGTESLWHFRSGTAAARRKLSGICQRFGLTVEPDARVGDLSVGEQQRVEILKALYNDARILVLDEPTAVLTNLEAERLFATLKEMAREGLSLIFISHKLDEVMAAADRIVVLRGGRKVAERLAEKTNKAELAELMVGRKLSRPVREPSTPGEEVLKAAGVSVIIDGVERLKSVDSAFGQEKSSELSVFPATARRHWRISCRVRSGVTGASCCCSASLSATLLWMRPSGPELAAFRKIATRRERSAKWPSGRTPFSSACRDFHAMASSIGRQPRHLPERSSMPSTCAAAGRRRGRACSRAATCRNSSSGAI